MNRLVGLVSFLFIGIFLARFALADEIIEEVIVQSAIVKSEVSTIADPLHVISEAELSSNPSQSLGETIDSLLGVASADYGAAVGQPIIRGMSGTRVRVLNNGMVIRDVTSLGADHVNEVDFNHAQQVEIIKGPASLLYTNGVIGGIVNVVDDTIARTDVEGVDISLGLEAQSVNDGDAQTASIATNVGGFNIFAAYSDSDLENYDVPDGAVIHEEEEHHDEDEHEGEEEHHDEEEHEEEIEYIDSDDSATSFAVSVSRDMNENFSVNLGFASVGRTPAATEMLMNGPHLATRRFEKGNPNLKAERSNNLDFTLNFQNQGYFGELTLFSNSVSDYIYLMDETEEEHEEHEDEHDDHGGLILAEFLQQDADFTGYELEIGKTFDLSRGNLTLSYGRDSVTAEFSNGGNVPRIIPARNIYAISYLEDTLAVRLSLKDVGKQSDTAIGETATEGYQMLNLRANKSIQFDSGLVLNLTAFGNNLMDEVARNHSSFVKNEVPLPGRNLGVKFSIDI